LLNRYQDTGADKAGCIDSLDSHSFAGKQKRVGACISPLMDEDESVR
jgi:hypothetical protein